MARYKLDTDNSGNDEILVGDSVAEVTQDVLNRYEVDELPEDWTIDLIDDSTQTGYVIGSNGRIYVQVRDDSQFGFAICDDEQSWAGGVGSGLTSWTLIASDDSRITDNDRERLGWILDEQSSDMPPPAVAFEITEQALAGGQIVHTGWTLNGRDTRLMDPRPEVQCGVNAWTWFDSSGKFLGEDEHGLMPTFEPSTPAPFSVQWEFMGPATQERFDAAQAVADAMEILGTIEATKDVLAKACQILNMDLGGDWDSKSVLAMIENCSFSGADEGASADA